MTPFISLVVIIAWLLVATVNLHFLFDGQDVGRAVRVAELPGVSRSMGAISEALSSAIPQPLKYGGAEIREALFNWWHIGSRMLQ